MKKSYYLGAVLITILALLFTLAASPGEGAQAPRFIQLMVTRFVSHKGYVFIFQLSGKFRKDELIGTVTVSGQKIKMHCVLRENDVVACTASHLKKHVGKRVWVSLAGYGEYVTVPEPRVTVTVCYPVYDWGMTPGVWDHFADYCQYAQPEVGDGIELFNPNWNATYTYFYQTSVPCADQGNGYYFGISDGNYYAIMCP